MARHDFNQPCDCRECRELPKEIVCPNCSRCHIVIIDRNAEWTTDRKGVTGVDFHIPDFPSKTLVCECEYVINEIGYYTYYDREGTIEARERLAMREAAIACQGCGRLEGIDYVVGYFEKIRLIERDSMLLCQSCLADRVQSELKDPSDETRKFKFDRKKLSWNLDKVKVPCVRCGKLRWLNAGNQWKSLCITCYRRF